MGAADMMAARSGAKAWGLILLALAILAAPSPALATDPASVACAPTWMPVMERVIQTLAEGQPPLELSQRQATSSEAMTALLAGEASLAAIVRQPIPEEEALARTKGLSLTRQQVGTDCLLVVVHPLNPIFDLTLAEARGVFSGRLRHWCEVGGKDRRIVVVTRPPDSGAAQMWQGRVMEREAVRADAQVEESHQDVLQAVANNKLAIGYISLGFLDPSVKALSLDGINPGVANVKAGRYPVCRPLLLVSVGQPTGAAKAALDFLTGPQGQETVRGLGFLPMR